MAQSVFLSIGIPFLNAERTLADAVRSVFAQTFTNWELLLVDDGSSDASVNIARAIADPRVRVFSDGVNKGLCARLNQIAALAQGELLARMDADDLMHPERLERQVAFLEANPLVDVVDSACYTLDNDLTPLGMRGERALDIDPDKVLTQGLLVHPAVTGWTSWFREHPYDAEYVRAEDRELWCRTCTSSRFARIAQPLFLYREGLSGNLKAYLRSEKTLRRIFRVYGPGRVGRWRTLRLLVRSYGKSLAYRLLHALGLQRWLIAGRNRRLSPQEQHAVQAILARIAQTAVPGCPTSATPANPYPFPAAAEA